MSTISSIKMEKKAINGLGILLTEPPYCSGVIYNRFYFRVIETPLHTELQSSWTIVNNDTESKLQKNGNDSK